MSSQKIRLDIKERIVSLSGACFWYWKNFYIFLEICGVPKDLQQRYPRGAYNKYDVMRNILEYLEETNNTDIINNIISNFFRLQNAVDRDALDNNKAKQLLEEFREMVGNDPIDQEIERRKREEARVSHETEIERQRGQRQRLEDLNSLFISLTISDEYTPQQRGYKLEDIFCELLQLNELEYSRPYRTPNGEQIDGYFRYENFDYLLEVKWKKDLIKQEDLSVFDGKIRGKAQSTRGLFLSASGFDENAISKFSGDSPRIILLTGEDLAIILNGKVLFHDAMKAKVTQIVKYGNINYPLRNI